MSDENGDSLCGTGLSIDWLENIVREQRNISDEVKVGKWEAHKIGVGMGFLSHILKVTLEWEGKWSDVSDLPQVLVLKVPTSETMKSHVKNFSGTEEDKKKMEEAMEQGFLPNAHRTECSVYNLFRENPVEGVPIPRTYFCRPMSLEAPGVIVMEDLSKGTQTVNLVDCLRLSQIKNVIQHVAHLHSFSLLHRDKWADVIRVMDRSMFNEFDKTTAMTLKKLEDLKPEYFRGKLDPIRSQLTTKNILHILETSHENLGLPSVFCHGDLWTNNILFEKDEKEANGAGDKVVAIIDWQTCHPGNLGEDIARLLVMGATVETRHNHLDEILAHYYATLEADMGGAVPFKLEDVKKAFDSVMPFAASCFLFPLPMLINTPMVDGPPSKEARVDQMLKRGKALMEDLTALTSS